MTRGEKYAIFLLLMTPRGNLRQQLEGTHNANGIVAGAPGAAASAADLVVRAKAGLAKVGVSDTAFAEPINLAQLYDSTMPRRVTTDATTIAGALAMDDYSGNCPDVATEEAILKAVKAQIP